MFDIPNKNQCIIYALSEAIGNVVATTRIHNHLIESQFLSLNFPDSFFVGFVSISVTEKVSK